MCFSFTQQVCDEAQTCEITIRNRKSEFLIVSLRKKRFGMEVKMKLERHTKIIELINEYDIETQDELGDLLNKCGYNVTQATISRDIRQLKLVKQAVGDKQKYIVMNGYVNDTNDKYTRILRDGFLSMAMAQNILVIKTVSGMAMAVAAALDAMQWNEIVGCIAGDDTIMCAIRTLDDTLIVMDKLNKLLNRD